jgi:hypothetical protein
MTVKVIVRKYIDMFGILSLYCKGKKDYEITFLSV